MNEIRILNQLFAAQSMLNVFPDDRSMGVFAAHVLRSVPGVSACSLVIRDQQEVIGGSLQVARDVLFNLAQISEGQERFSIAIPDEEWMEAFSLETSQRQFGFVFIQLADQDLFEPFRPALRNSINMLAVQLENNWQKLKVKVYQQHLEELVEVRTTQLQIEIAGRNKVQEELQISRNHYQDLVETAQDLIWECDAQGRFTFINGAWEDVLGYRLDEMLGHVFTEFQDDQHATKDKGELQFLLAGNSDSKYETIYRAKDGREVTLIFNGKYYTDELGQALGARGTAYDISARKQAEKELHEAHDLLEQRVVERTEDLQASYIELEKSSRLKDEFIATMSHELRTPLTGILGLSEVLQMQAYGALSEKQLTALKNIEKSGRQLLEIVNNILDYSMLEAGKLQLQLAPCSLAELGQNSLYAVEKLAQQKDLCSNFSIDPNAIILSADVRRLKQALFYLLSNAIKFTPVGGSFGIVVNGLESERRVLISVWDTGIGIRAEDFPRLFQPFHQLDARLSREYNGIGLGLALVRRLVELHGGSIGVESKLDEGSRFTISLPWTG